MNMDFGDFLGVIMDLKYSQRLNMLTFGKLFYPNATDESFLKGEWYSFNTAPIRYLWGLSNEQIEKLHDYINDQKATLGWGSFQ